MASVPIIEIRNLSKRYGSIHAVSDLNLEVFHGDVFGFLGPNGAGKSSTIRMLFSLVKPTRGSIFLFGKDLATHRGELVSRIGCIIEKPDFYLYLSAARNLDLFSRLSGFRASRTDIYRVLELVGLKGREQSPVKTYSHGMKQRLGIAQTLIHDPELIILDEPTTGLDPQGIIDVRNLILHLQRDLKKTIFLSSHILSEIEQIASRMAILNRGRTVAQGNVSELLSTQDLLVTIEAENMAVADAWLQQAPWKKNLHSRSPKTFQLAMSKNEIPSLTHDMQEAGIHYYSITYQRALEAYFLKLTRENNNHPINPGFSMK